MQERFDAIQAKLSEKEREVNFMSHREESVSQKAKSKEAEINELK